jgi:adenine-specific DNA-methyltransferase
MSFDFKLLRKEYKREIWKNFIGHVFQNESDLFAAPQSFPELHGERIQSFVQFGNIHLQDRYSSQLALFEVILHSGTTKLQINRVALREIVEKLRRNTTVTGAIAIFADPSTGKWRFTFIAKQEVFGGPTIETVDPRRFTYVFGNGETTTTAEQRFALLANTPHKQLEDIVEAFSVEKVSEEFFKAYKSHYETLCVHLYENPKSIQIFKADTPAAAQKLMRDFAKRLIGRLVFLYFLQKKGWLGQDANFVARLFHESKASEKFYSNELRRLFFETLNTPREGDGFTTPWGQVKIPYLNGGLFDNELTGTEALNFPSDWFAEVFEFFGHYNFTIDETGPNDQEVGIDPEMLGHIFENLLEENREKGAIYTPKEIVHFMCQKSLVEYLTGKFPDMAESKALQDLVKHKIVSGLTNNQLNEVLTCLDHIRICDPAIGSGAFPMGMLHEIYAIKEAIYIETKGLKAIKPAKLKIEIIQNSIFGVDIDAGAVDIARLRFWLALVVEEEAPQLLPNLDYKIMQGNSLLECFEGIDLSNLLRENGNVNQTSPTQLFQQIEEPSVQFGEKDKARLAGWIEQFFSPKIDVDKTELQSKINNLIEKELNEAIRRHKVQMMLRSAELKKAYGKVSTKQEKEIKRLEAEVENCEAMQIRITEWQKKNEKPYFLWHTWFREVFDDGGFDIVIANPPYMRVQEIEKSFPAEKKQYEETLSDGKPRFEVAKGAYDIANLFFELAIKKLSKPEGVNCFIFPHKFFNAGSGEAFRDFLMKGRYIDRIAHFGANRVFNDVDTYVCIALFSAQKNDGFWLQKFPFRSDFQSLMLDDSRYQFIEYSKLENAARLHGSNQWIFFESADEYLSFENIYQNTKPFSIVFEDIFQGIATSHDKLYFLEIDDENEAYYFGKNQVSEKRWQVEKEFFKPILKGKDVHRFAPLQTKIYVFFPYKFEVDEKGKEVAKPVSLLFFKENYPFTHAFVVEQESEFKAREHGKAAKMPFWYEYIYPKNLVKFEQLKLSSMEICTTHPNVTLNAGDLYHNTKVYSWVKSKETSESYEYLLAISNSSLLWWFLKNTGDTLQGDARTLKTNYLNPFPLPEQVNEGTEKAIAQIVRYLLWLGTGGTTGLSLSNDAVSQNLRQVLDACVCELYFGIEMTEKSVDVLRFVKQDLGNFTNETVTSEQVAAVFKKWQQPDSEVRNRLKLMTIRLPELLKPILESTQPR